MFVGYCHKMDSLKYDSVTHVVAQNGPEEPHTF